MNKQQLASKIWESANKMRSKIEANEYKDYILGFMFYKFLSDKEVEFLKKDGWDNEALKELVEEDEETVAYLQKSLGYFISYKDLFSTWIEMGMDFDVSNVRDALNAFSRLISDTHKKVFNNIFKTLQEGLSSLGDSSGSQTKAIRDLIQLIKQIPMDGRQDYDVLGFIYEYLISMFAANAGKKAGEFYTPHEVSFVMSEIVANHLKDRDKIEIYDPTSGSGSLLINIGRSVSKYISNKDNIKYYAQELKENTYNLTRMNLVMRGILPDNIITRCGDTLEEDWPYFDESDPSNTYNPLYVDAVVSNPPYSQPWDPANKDVDPRYARYGMAPKAKADYAFLLHDLYHIKPNGIMTIVLPHGVLFRGGEEEKIRKNLIENNNIDAIIGLPANIFFGTGIPTIIMVLKQKRTNNDVLIIDASKGFTKVGKNNKLRASDIKKIVDTVTNRVSIDKYSRVVSKEEIRNNEYNLNIPRYVDSSEAPESWDIYASMFGGIPNTEIDNLKDYWSAFTSLKSQLFKSENQAYSALAVKEIKDTIENNADVKSFKETYNNQFADFKDYLKGELIAKMNEINVSREESVISSNIFDRLKNIALLDKYQAYQLLDNEWTKIAVDLEIIQTEGFGATKQVDPNMVVKKKDGKDEEVQDGWVGHIIPFDLVQNTLLLDKTTELRNKENELSAIAGEYEEIIDNISEEDKDSISACFNEDNTAFVPKEVAKKAKEYLKISKSYAEDTLEAKIIRVNNLMDTEKTLKKDIKTSTEQLISLSIETIKGLSDEQVLDLLEKKWIDPIVNSLNKLPDTIIKELETAVQALANKYEMTYVDLASQIEESENSLATLLDELEGNEFDMKGLEELKKMLRGE